jgi:hypothetical protein
VLIHASGVPIEQGRWTRPPLTLWLRDDRGDWHVTDESTWSTLQNDQLSTELEIVPPLPRTTSIEIIAVGQSAETRTTLTALRWYP